MYNINSVERNWSERLENVLNDYDALNLFKQWMGVDDDSNEHPIRLHFAIVAFKEMVNKNDARYVQLAKDIYNKFLKQKGGLCEFIDEYVRETIGRKVRQLIYEKSPQNGICRDAATIFDTCLQQVDTFLRKQHALFVSSQEFLDFFNSSLNLDDTNQESTSAMLPPGNATQHKHAGRRKGHKSHKDETGRAPKLTADSLLRSQRDRETALGQSIVEKMFTRPAYRYPYVCNATTSKNDSAVSSSFSSDANGQHRHAHHYSTRVMREEHRRVNPNLVNFPRPEPPTVPSTIQYRHETEEGRRKFVEALVTKLHILIAKNKEYERMSEQMEKIVKAGKSSAREVIRESATTADDPAELDADDDVDNYFKQRMMPDSQQSPAPQSRRTRRRSSRSYSPDQVVSFAAAPGFSEAFPLHQQQYTVMMSQSYINPNSYLPDPTQRDFLRTLNYPLNTDASVRNEHSGYGRQNMNAGSELRGYNHHKSCSPDRFNSVGGYYNMMATTSYYDSTPIPHCTGMSQSAYVCPNSGRNMKMGFAPPPGVIPQFTPKAGCGAGFPEQQTPKCCKDGYYDNDGDTSGIGSMTTHFSDQSSTSFNKQRAAVFKKARQLSSMANANQPGTE